jgi:nucleotide-binding universal stress UspA family protein
VVVSTPRVFPRIALAAGFTPRLGALLKEAARISRQWHGELLVIHVGQHLPELSEQMYALMEQAGLNPKTIPVIWESGPPAKTIIEVCEREKVDLLLAGALQREKAMQYYLGSVARRLLRRAPCSVLMLTHPAESPAGFKNIVVQADEDNPFMPQTLRTACILAGYEQAAWLHVVRKLKWYAFLSGTEEFSASEYEHTRNQLIQAELDDIQHLLQAIPHAGIKVNIKLISGKAGHELAQFTQRKQADLLVVSASPLRLSLLDRLLPNDLEYLFGNLPCNLLVVKLAKGGAA